jgi:hypothetical protein
VAKRAVPADESDTDLAAVGMSEDELIERATSDRIAGRETDGQVDALLRVAAETNRAALDRLAR